LRLAVEGEGAKAESASASLRKKQMW
jgi:hypothetical protein